MKRFFSRVMLILSVLSLALCASGQSIGIWDAASEQEIFRLLNQERTRRGLQPLQMEPNLATIARRHSQRMAEQSALSHQFSGEPGLNERLAPAGIHFDVSGENVAVNTTAAGAHMGLMGSPPHRENILNSRYNAIGIGVLRAGQHIWVTQDFVNHLAKTSVADAELQIARQFNDLRRSARSSTLPLIANPKLRELACQMARYDTVSPAQAGTLPNVARVVAFTVANLTQMPTYLQAMKTAPASGFSVGACYTTSSTYSVPVYWIIVATYF
ncbi:MAG: CAP domain-containing protein [Candidatus Korobacteraceae bacterium]